MSECVLVEINTDKPELDCKLCYLPAQTEDSKIQLGPLYEYGVCRSHHFCLMFSSGLEQKGEEEEGIKGFMPADIIKEWKRGGFLKCFYCKKKHATVGCFESNCRKCYHLPCGLKNGALQQFYGNFKTFCIDHRPVQTPLAKKIKKTKLDKDCGICLDTLDKDWNENIWTPCCGGWFHRTCMTRMASTAGAHFFKCPLCNNIDEFTQEMLEFGIYVPDQDAKWETEGEAFNDLLLRPDTCDAPVCKCPGGRKMDVEDSKWETVICVCCGAQGIHIECGGLNFDRPRWKCDTCRDVLKKIPNKPVSVFSRVKRNQQDEAGTMEKLMTKIKFNVKPSRTPLTSIHNIQVTVGHVKLRLDSAPVLDIPFPVQLKQENKKQLKSAQSRENEEESSEESSDAEKAKKQRGGQKFEKWIVKSDSCDISAGKSTSSVASKDSSAGESDSGVVNLDSNAVEIDSSEMCVSPKPINAPEPAAGGSATEPAAGGSATEPAAGGSAKQTMAKSESRPQGMKRKRSVEKVDDRKRIKLDTSQTSITSFFKPRAATSTTISVSPAQTSFKIQTESPSWTSRAKVLDAVIIVSDDEDDIAPETSSSVQDCKSKTPEKSSSVAERQTIISEKSSSVQERLSASFVCCYCKIGFSNLLSWKQHVNSHRSGFRCGICDEVFATEKLLKKHDACKNSSPNELEEGILDCPLCEYSAKSGKGLRIHSKRKHGINSESETPVLPKSECGYYCKKCKYFTLSKAALKIHAAEVHQDSNQDCIHQCSLCDAIFITSMALTLHTHSIHHKKKVNCDCVFSCDLCKFVATTSKGLTNHMRTCVSQAADGDNSQNTEAIDVEDDLEATGNGSEADEPMLEEEGGESKPKGNHIRNITSDWD